MMRCMIRSFIVLLFCMSISPCQAAQVSVTDSKEAIEKVIRSYGGDQLRNLTHLRFDYEWQLAWPGQSYDLSRVNFVTDKNQQFFNFKDKKASTERWISQNGNVYHNKTTSIGEDTFVIDYFTQQYSEDEHQNFDSQLRILSLYVDVYLAYAMTYWPDKFTLVGKGHVEGHETVVFHYQYSEESQPLVINVHPRLGYIIETHRVSNSGVVTRNIYQRHKVVDGVVFSEESRVFRNDDLVYYSVENSMSARTFSDDVFKKDANINPQDEMLEASEMTVVNVGEKTTHVGHDGAYSTFFENGDHVIGVNPYGGMKARLDEYRKAQKLPITHWVLTHHHSDHLSGLKDAIDAGMTLIMTEMTQQHLSDSGEYDLEGVEVVVVKDKLSMGDVNIHMVNTTHAAENLVVYHGKDKVLYQDDHYNANNKDKHSHVNQSGLVLNQRLMALKLDIDWILGGHALKAEAWDDFQKGVKANSIGHVCPNKRSICANEMK